MKLSRKSRGLGDTVEKITTVTGIKSVVDKVSKVSKKPCGCKERKARARSQIQLTTL